MPGRRVVMLSPVLPYAAVPHAGGRYLLHLVDLLERHADLTLIVPSTPVNRVASGQPGAPAHHLLVGAEPGRSARERLRNRLLVTADRGRRALDPGLAPLTLAAALARPGPARDAIATADVVDLQWSESIRLADRVRRLAPRARLVGTFHDVQSQLFGREPSRFSGDRLHWAVAAAAARRHERSAVGRLDEVVVFSRKDADLLGALSARVLLPALARGDEVPRASPPGPPTVLVVAHLARDENDDAARWLVREIWPGVAARCPGARLRLVGSGMLPDLAALVAARDDVTAPGYVEDLGPEYAAAWCCVVPLRQGAGVKFKTVEALLHDVPTVTTSVGAEGIDGPDLFAAVGEDVASLTAGVVDTLLRPEDHRARAATAQRWAVAAYGQDRFADAVRAVYGLPG